jgi:replication-associated recombination protein RarA
MVFKVKPIGESAQRFLSVIYGPPGSGKTYGASTLDGKPSLSTLIEVHLLFLKMQMLMCTLQMITQN